MFYVETFLQELRIGEEQEQSVVAIEQSKEQHAVV